MQKYWRAENLAILSEMVDGYTFFVYMYNVCSFAQY